MDDSSELGDADVPLARPPTPKPRNRRSSLRFQESLSSYLFVSPWLVGFLIFTLLPMLFSIYLSFSEWDLVRSPEFVGLANYQELLDDTVFRTAVYNTLYYTIFSVPLSLAVSFGLALLLNQRVAGTGVWRTIFYLPAVMPAVATVVLWMWIFSTDTGLLNSLLARWGVPNINWLGDPDYTKPSLIIMSLWQAGGGTVILLAALKNVPQELYEAAMIDGANAWQRFRYITIAMVSPALFFNLIINSIYALQLFTPTYILTARLPTSPGGPKNTLMFYVMYMYLHAFRYFKLGYASALAWVLFIAILVLTAIQFKTLGSRVYYEFERK